jgi:hypothetical protein
MTRIGCMRMRRRSESIRDIFTSCLCAQMSISQKSGKHPLGMKTTWEENPSIDVR